MDGECCGGIFRFPAVADVPYRKEEEVRILAERCRFASWIRICKDKRKRRISGYIKQKEAAAR